MIQHGVDGFVVAEPADARALAGELERLFDESLRLRIGAAAARTAQRISQNNPGNEIARIVEDLADCRRAEAGVLLPSNALTP